DHGDAAGAGGRRRRGRCPRPGPDPLPHQQRAPAGLERGEGLHRARVPHPAVVAAARGRDPGRHRVNRLSLGLSRVIARVTDSALGPYQTAVIRIGFGLTWLLFLLREYPHRQELYGPDGPWEWDLADQLVTTNDAFTVLLWSDSQVWFEAVYALAVLWSVLMLLGWRTRTMSVL